MLDPDDRDAELAADPPQHLGRVVHLGGVETAEALVGEEQRRLRGERARQLELLEAARAEQRRGGQGIGGQADQRREPPARGGPPRPPYCAPRRRSARRRRRFPGSTACGTGAGSERSGQGRGGRWHRA